MAFDRSRSIPEPVNESDDEPDAINLWDVDWEDPGQVQALMTEIDAKVEAEEGPEHPYMRWLKEDRQHRINSWGATFFQAGVIPPDGWEDWVR